MAQLVLEQIVRVWEQKVAQGKMLIGRHVVDLQAKFQIKPGGANRLQLEKWMLGVMQQEVTWIVMVCINSSACLHLRLDFATFTRSP